MKIKNGSGHPSKELLDRLEAVRKELRSIDTELMNAGIRKSSGPTWHLIQSFVRKATNHLGKDGLLGMLGYYK